MIERPKMNEVRPDRNFAITMEAAPRSGGYGLSARRHLILSYHTPGSMSAAHSQDCLLKSSTTFHDSCALAKSMTSCPSVFLIVGSAPFSRRNATCSSSSRYVAL